MKFPDGLRALNHRNYRLFFFGQLISLIGSWMQTVGQSWLVVQLTDSAFKLGLISTLQFLPTLLFALVGGALADRLPKRKALIGTQTALMVLALVLSLLVWSGHVQYWHVTLLALALGLANTLDMPVRQAFTVEMVGGREDLGNAIALNSAIFNGGRLLGPAVAGLLVAKYGVALAFLLNGVSFVAVIAALCAITVDGLPTAVKHRAILGDIKEGLRYVLQTPLALFLINLVLIIGLFVINYSVLVTVLAKGVLNQGAQGYGYLMASLGAGALVGSVALAFRKRGEPKLPPLVTAGLALCISCTLMYFVHTFWLAAVGLFAMGLSQILFTADANTTLQLAVPNELRGRVMSIYQLVFAGSTPFGSLITGAVIEHFGGSVGFLADGGLGLIGTLVLLVWWRTSRQKTGVPATQSVGAAS